jgi:hypothetical protein
MKEENKKRKVFYNQNKVTFVVYKFCKKLSYIYSLVILTNLAILTSLVIFTVERGVRGVMVTFGEVTKHHLYALEKTGFCRPYLRYLRLDKIYG